MTGTIEDLWNGNIAPMGNCGVGNPQIENLVMLIERHRETLDNELSQQQKDILQKYINCSDKYSLLISECAFRDGFSLGCRLMSEAFFEE